LLIGGKYDTMMLLILHHAAVLQISQDINLVQNKKQIADFTASRLVDTLTL